VRLGTLFLRYNALGTALPKHAAEHFLMEVTKIESEKAEKAARR
jgi:hypothetical protein